MHVSNGFSITGYLIFGERQAFTHCWGDWYSTAEGFQLTELAIDGQNMKNLRYCRIVVPQNIVIIQYSRVVNSSKYVALT